MEEQVNDADRGDAQRDVDQAAADKVAADRHAALAASAAELGLKVDRLTAAVDRLDKSQAKLETRTGKVERRSVRSVVMSVLIAGGMVTGALLGYTQFVANDRLDTVIEHESRVTQEVLCPLFGLMLGGYDPNSRPAGPERERYVETFGELTRIYMKLQCTAPAVSPPGSSVPPR